MKATFDMVIVAPKDRVVLSNMPEIESSEDPEDAGYNIVKFATSPVMSTYLVAVVVGEFDYIEDKTSEGRLGCNNIIGVSNRLSLITVCLFVCFVIVQVVPEAG